MKLGLIADIHADYDAFVEALVVLERERVDTLLCAGDLVDKGTQGDAVVAHMRARAIPCVLGNHDEIASETQRRLRAKLARNEAVNPQVLLKDETLAFLAELPFALRFNLGGWRVLLVHGSSRNNRDYLFAASPSIKFKNLAAEARADVIICGHTHEAMHIRARGAHFINPGAVCGANAWGSHTCATFDLTSMRLKVFDLATGNSSDYDPIKH